MTRSEKRCCKVSRRQASKRHGDLSCILAKELSQRGNNEVSRDKMEEEEIV